MDAKAVAANAPTPTLASSRREIFLLFIDSTLPLTWCGRLKRRGAPNTMLISTLIH
jgi:hypothetical protein